MKRSNQLIPVPIALDNRPEIVENTPINGNANDSFSNPAARTGYGTANLMEATQYPDRRMTQNWGLLTSLYKSNYVVQNIIETIPLDITKSWFDIKTARPPEDITKFNRMQRSVKLRQSIVEGWKWGRLYGGAGGLIKIAGQNNLEEPLDYNKIMPDSFRGLYIMDRWLGIDATRTEITQDINSLNFGLPEYYVITNRETSEISRVHYSRIVRFTGRKLPYLEEIYENYWGQSEIEAIYDEIVKKDNISNNMATLTFKAATDVMEVEGLDQVIGLASNEMQARFWNTIYAQSVMQSNSGIRLINKGDTFNQYQYNFAGLKDIYESILLDVAGAARTPATKLFSRSPQGMNATGESDLQIYEGHLEQVRENEFRPIIEQLLPIMALSCWGEIPDDLEIQFDSLRTITEEQKTKIAHTKVVTVTEAWKNYGIDQETYIRELKAISEDSGIFTHISDELASTGKGRWYGEVTETYDLLGGLVNMPDENLEQETLPEDVTEETAIIEEKNG